MITMKPKYILLWFFCLAFVLACLHAKTENRAAQAKQVEVTIKDSNTRKLVEAAIQQTHKRVTYDGSYFVIPYPNGDVPDSLGVCTDVIIRAYRKVGYDLQKLIHEDMKRAFSIYNARRHSDRIDANIDHRRTPNMEVFFTRFGKKLTITDSAKDYLPGDIVFWDVSAGHVGIVTNQRSTEDTSRFLIVHNIGSGPRLQDYLFDAKITGHYRYTPWKRR